MEKRLNTEYIQITVKIPLLMDIISILLSTGAFFLWYLSLKAIDVTKMNNLGLVSVMSPATIIALMIMMVSFCFTLLQTRLRTPIILLHFTFLIFMLYGVTTFVEQAPRFNIVYRHAGYTEYIMRTGTANPYLDAYFNWPGFFALTAFITQSAGYQDILTYAVWSPVFYNFLYFAALYLLFSTFTLNKRMIWLSIWIFHLTNWISQDYFSPQGLFFGLYLVILAILLKWFKTPPGTFIRPPGRHLSRIPFLPTWYTWLTAPDTVYTPASAFKRFLMLFSIFTIFTFIAFSHQLTPFFVLLSVTLLILFQRCTRKLWWLPVVMGIMAVAWLVIMAQPYLAGHTNHVFGGMGRILDSFNANVTNRVSGDPEHAFIARIRIIMTFLLWGLACIGALFRLLKGYRDASVIILALAPFPLFVAQPYGGEMLLRCYLFSQPSMVFLTASLFYDYPSFTSLFSFFARRLRRRGGCGGCGETPHPPQGRAAPVNPAEQGVAKNLHGQFQTVLKGTALACTLLVLLGGFLFTRYGNEHMDYKTYDEINGISYLYDNAPPDSLFVAAWLGTPWQVKKFEKFQLIDLSDSEEKNIDAIARRDINSIIRLMHNQKRPQAYLIFTRSQKATFDGTSGLAAGTLDHFELAIHASKDFILIYSNSDIQIFQLVSAVQGGQ
jgi:hypothetical protein